MTERLFLLLAQYAGYVHGDYIIEKRTELETFLLAIERRISLIEHYGPESEPTTRPLADYLSAVMGAMRVPKDAGQRLSVLPAMYPLWTALVRHSEKGLHLVPDVPRLKRLRGRVFDALDNLGVGIDSDLYLRSTRIWRRTNPLNGGTGFDLNLHWLLRQCVEQGISIRELAPAMIQTKLAPPRPGQSGSRQLTNEVKRLLRAASRYQIPVGTEPQHTA